MIQFAPIISLLTLLSLLSLPTPTSASTFPYSPTLQTTSYYSCYKSTTGSNRMALNLIYIKDKLNPDDVQNVQNALNAGLRVDLVVAPYRCRSVREEVEFIRGWIGGREGVERVWVDLASYDGGCDWGRFSGEDNCRYLVQLMAALKTINPNIGIPTIRTTWSHNFRSQTGCPQVSSYPLWWGPVQQQDDGQPNFNSYNQIGGWKSPLMKLYTKVQVCGQPILQSYSP